MLRVVVAVVCLAALVAGHGRMLDPAGRASAWRAGFDVPPNYDDDGLNCGGFGNQWKENDGKCGICGDPWQGPREHEAGGEYATGTIVRTYEAGAVIPVVIELTVNHMGWQEFRLCPHNDVRSPASQECLDQYVLPDLSGETRLSVPGTQNWFELELQLPEGLTCDQCVLQWKYHAGNSWNCDKETGDCGLGEGPQEQFYACADVRIV